jgi:methyl-accepting chemotaxis protein
MDQVTQQNASLVEEAAAAAESLQGQAGKLAELVSVFKLDARAPSVAAPAAQARTATRLAAPALRAAHPEPRKVAVREEEWETF